MKELDAMKSIWQNDDRGEVPVLDFMSDRIKQYETRTLQKRTRWSPIWDIVAAAILFLFTGNFVADNFQELLAFPAAAVPAALVFAFGLLSINLAVRQLILLYEFDYSKPILETQVQLAKLRKLRLRATQNMFVFGFSVWLMFPLLFGQMAAGVNFIKAVPAVWILANIAFSLAMMPVIFWFAKKSRFARSLQNSIVGKDILEAESFLRAIQEFKEN